MLTQFTTAQRSVKMVNAKNDAELQADLIAWIRSALRVRSGKVLTLKTRVNFDLGVAGADGFEFMEAFGKRYGVDLSMFDCEAYFGAEAGPNPFSLLWSLSRLLVGKKPSGLKPLFVSDLVELAKSATTSA